MEDHPTQSAEDDLASGPGVGCASRAGLADRLQQATHSLHVQAERSGVIADLLRGDASRFGYVVYLRNLLPAYDALEAGLREHSALPAVADLARPSIYRAAALEADIGALHGQDWRKGLPALAASQAYVRRIHEATRERPHRLVAHAYVRYLGDLNGGHILGRLVARAFDLEPSRLGFYRFPEIADLDRFKTEYRAAIDSAPLQDSEATDVLEEGKEAFRLNIVLSEAVRSAAG